MKTAPRPFDRIFSSLAEVLAPLEPAWRAQVVERFERHAQAAFDSAKKKFAEGDEKWFNRWMPGRYITFPRNDRHWSRGSLFEQQRAYAANGEMKCNIEHAREDGGREFDNLRAAFLHRVATKLGEAFGDLLVDAVLVDLAFNGMIQGGVTAKAGKAAIVVNVEVMTNYRYGENSANPSGLTVYAQYPVRVRGVYNREGAPVSCASIDDAAVAIIGRNPAEEKRAAKAARKARLLELKALEYAAATARQVHADCVGAFESIAFAQSAECSWTQEQKDRAIGNHRHAIEQVCKRRGFAIPLNIDVAKMLLAEARVTGAKARAAYVALKASPL